MPAAYAHYTFGKQVFDRLPKPVRRLIGQSALHKRLYAIGLQGPDILFFYHPWCVNKLNRAGNRIHQQPAAEFLEAARGQLGDPPDPALLCYLLGFVCHFVLDSQCHPYISRRIEEAKAANMRVTHHEIESEFDRMLMERDGRNPLTFNPTCYAVPDAQLCATIAQVYPGATPKKIQEALNSMMLVRDLMTGRTPAKRTFMGAATRAVGLKGLSLPAYANPRCLISSRELDRIYTFASLQEAVSLVVDFYYLAYNGAPLPSRFQRNFE